MVFNKENWMFFLSNAKLDQFSLLNLSRAFLESCLIIFLIHFYHRIKLQEKYYYENSFCSLLFNLKLKIHMKSGVSCVKQMRNIFGATYAWGFLYVWNKIIIRMCMNCHGDVVRLKFTSSFIFLQSTKDESKGKYFIRISAGTACMAINLASISLLSDSFS